MNQLNYIKESILSAPSVVANTPFAKDVVANGGVFGVVTAAHKGVERESLKMKIFELETRLAESLKTSADVLLSEYDKYGDTCVYKDLVLEKRAMLLRKLNGLILKQNDPELANDQHVLESEKEGEQLSDMWFVYVLALENNKYYVGRTNNVNSDIERHKAGEFCEFTRINKPMNSFEFDVSTSTFDEDCMVKKYMSTDGINNVRGGSYSSLELTCGQIMSLQRELMYAANKKLICSDGHDMTNFNSTYISTYLMCTYSGHSIEKVAQLRQLTPETIVYHLKKCEDIGLCIMNKHIN